MAAPYCSYQSKKKKKKDNGKKIQSNQTALASTGIASSSYHY